jgi:hypothetical protein
LHRYLPSIAADDQPASAKQANKKREPGQWRMPEQSVNAAPGEECVDWNEYCQ